MAQPTPEKILAIIDDHDRAQKKQRNKNVFIYLCLCLAIIATFRLDGVAVLTSDRILSILDKTKDHPTIRRKVVNRLLSGSKLTGKDEEYIFSELKKAEQSNEREKRLQAIKEYTS